MPAKKKNIVKTPVKVMYQDRKGFIQEIEELSKKEPKDIFEPLGIKKNSWSNMKCGLQRFQATKLDRLSVTSGIKLTRVRELWFAYYSESL